MHDALVVEAKKLGFKKEKDVRGNEGTSNTQWGGGRDMHSTFFQDKAGKRVFRVTTAIDNRDEKNNYVKVFRM
jgi:hypothetical protein